MIYNGDVILSCVGSFVEVGPALGVFIDCQVKGVSCWYGKVLIFWCMIDAIFPDKLEAFVGFVLFKCSYCSFGEWDA